jgi:hypothetical protein
MDNYIYLKEKEIQKEGDEYHLQNGWITIPSNFINQPNIGFFQIRRKIEEDHKILVKEAIKENITWIQKIIKYFKH